MGLYDFTIQCLLRAKQGRKRGTGVRNHCFQKPLFFGRETIACVDAQPCSREAREHATRMIYRMSARNGITQDVLGRTLTRETPVLHSVAG